jgi:predicted CopG family antitoxin
MRGMDVYICAYIYTYYMTKIISLSEKAYESLKKLKRDGESFSDVVTRLTKEDGSTSLLPFAGKWVGNDLEMVFERISEERRKSASREAKI